MTTAFAKLPAIGAILVLTMLVIGSFPVMAGLQSSLKSNIADPSGSSNFPLWTPSSSINLHAYAMLLENQEKQKVASDPQPDMSCQITGMNLTQACIRKLGHTHLAVVNPVFTTTAYQTNGFYDFYKLHAKTPYGQLVKKDLQLLNLPIQAGWGIGGNLYDFLHKYEINHTLNASTPVLTDIDVSNGLLFFANGARQYDVVLVGFSEYVTLAEYNYYKHFVETGGVLVLLDACNFVAQVSYDAATNTMSLVSGHGWNFNGSAAWKGPESRWAVANTNWVGSDYRLFYTDGYAIDGGNLNINNSNPLSAALLRAFNSETLFQGAYSGHEENIVTNFTVNIVISWDLDNWKNSSQIVAAYTHEYRQGMVIHTGIFGTDLIGNNFQMQFFVLICVLSKAS